jgi:hypothetical protein
MADQPAAGGSGVGHNVPTNQNVVIDQAAQNAAAQMAKQILANTNVTLKQELVKIPDFWGEKARHCYSYTVYGKDRRMPGCQRLERHHHVRQFQPLPPRRG